MLEAPVQRIKYILINNGDIENNVPIQRVYKLLVECMGEEYHRYPDGRMLIWDLARHDGYTIPPYPMAGCGDVKEFLSDEGAKNVPDWYRIHLGIDKATYDNIYKYELVMVRNKNYYRKVWLIDSDIINTLNDETKQLRSYMLEWIEFMLGTQDNTVDRLLFKR